MFRWLRRGTRPQGRSGQGEPAQTPLRDALFGDTSLSVYPKTAMSHRMLAQADWTKASQLLAFLHQRVWMLRRLTSQAKVRSKPFW